MYSTLHAVMTPYRPYNQSRAGVAAACLNPVSPRGSITPLILIKHCVPGQRVQTCDRCCEEERGGAALHLASDPLHAFEYENTRLSLGLGDMAERHIAV